MDELYETSTQYRLWTFTHKGLKAVRQATNEAAAAQAREAIQRVQQNKAGGGENGNHLESTESGTRKEIDCLTPDEEYKLVQYYCYLLMNISDTFQFPTAVKVRYGCSPTQSSHSVPLVFITLNYISLLYTDHIMKASAVMFLRRFFLRTSPMTYHPKEILTAVLFLTTKTENHYIPIQTFSEKIPKSTPEEIVALEFTVAMGLRWCFDIKHPFTPLMGATMELQQIYTGQFKSPAIIDPEKQSELIRLPPTELQQRLRNLPDASNNLQAHNEKRILELYHHARNLLFGSLLTDVAFLYSPSQIAVAAIYAIDPAVGLFYLDLKSAHPKSHPSYEEVQAAIQQCAGELRIGESLLSSKNQDNTDVKRIDRKLYYCRNPDKMDPRHLKRGIDSPMANKDADDGTQERDIKKRKIDDAESNLVPADRMEE